MASDSALTIQASDHAIKSVTIFKSLKAEVIRTFTLNLKRGLHRVGIKGLPSSIDTESVRVSGLGKARLIDVVCTNKAAFRAHESLSEIMRTLSAKKAGLEREKLIKEQESKLLLKYAETLNGEHITATQVVAFLESCVDQGRKALQAVNQFNEQIIQINRQIEVLQEKAALKRGTTIVSNVQWKPLYELHATTENGKPSSSVALHYRAMVTQSTGEEWNNTSLTLSTVALDDAVKGIPQLRPIKLVQPRTLTLPLASESAIERAISEPTTFVSETPIAVSFPVHGESTIPSDGVSHRVSVAVLPLNAKTSYICIPRMDPRAFLQCEVTNSSGYRLLSGPVAVIVDNNYVSKTSLNDINSGDHFECILGHDASTKVTYSRSSKTVKLDKGTFTEVTNTTTYTTKISIHNKHQFDITDLIVREVIPTSDDKRVGIILRKPVGLLDAKEGAAADLKDDGVEIGWVPVVNSGEGGKKEGRFEWRLKVGSGAKVDLEAEWDMTVPGAAPWVEANQLSPRTLEDDWRVARTKLHNIKTGALRYVKAHKEVKIEWSRLRRQFVLKIGQLTNDPSEISRISQQLIEIVEPSNAPPHDSNLYIALCYSLAKAIVLQAEVEVAAEKRSAAPLAQVAFTLLVTLDEFPSIFFAKLVQRCGGWLLPTVVPYKTVDDTPWSREQVIKVSGWRENTIGEGLETPEEYANRISAIMRVYFNILKIPPGKKALDPMFQLPRCWTWFARMVGNTKLLQEAAAPQFIFTGLDVLGLTAKNIWGQQWMKMLSLIHQGITVGYENGKLIGGESPEGARSRVLVALENIVNEAQL